jgi:myo-inositol 2-dehydrogenase/D-chiro-inositol 1-dehydrogenase
VFRPPLRFALIGCGQQGRLLAAALRRVPDTQLIACSDPDPVALNAIPGAGVVRFADYQALLDASAIDAAIVATPHLFLADAAQAVVQAGRHVFCEKPLAASAADAQSVVVAASRAGVNLMVGYVQRFDPLRQRMKCLLDEGAFGELAYVVAGKGGPPLSGWQQNRANGGGQLLWVGSHLIDQLHWLLGRRVERVFAEIRRSESGATDMTSVVTLRCTDGLLVHLDCSQAAADVYDYVEAVGSAGRIRGEWRPKYHLAIQSQLIQSHDRPRSSGRVAQSLARACVAELTEFAASIRAARPPAVTGTDAVQVLEVLDAIALSAERGQPVTIEHAT